MKKLVVGFAGLLGLVLLLSGGYVAANYAPDLPVAALSARWATPPSKFIDVLGMSVHVRDEGPPTDALPIVLLHGTSASLHTWDGWAEALRGERRVIRFDMPGFGLTGPAPDGKYAIADYVRFVTATLDALGVKQFVIAGNSLGGHIAWETAAAAPERVKGLILVDAGGYAMAAKSMPIGFRIARTPGLNRVMQIALPRSMVESSVRNVYGDPSKVTPELIDRYYDLTRREGNRAALAARFEQSSAADRVDAIKSLKVPTLILWGSKDQLIPPDRAELFKHDIEGSTLVTFEGLGHVPHEEDPTKTVAEARKFLLALSKGDGGSGSTE